MSDSRYPLEELRRDLAALASAGDAQVTLTTATEELQGTIVGLAHDEVIVLTSTGERQTPLGQITGLVLHIPPLPGPE